MKTCDVQANTTLDCICSTCMYFVIPTSGNLMNLKPHMHVHDLVNKIVSIPGT